MNRRLRVVDHSEVTLVDTCVLIDVLTDDPKWADWSADALADARDNAEMLSFSPYLSRMGHG